MTCKKCGSALSPNANFCHHCGEKQNTLAWQPTAPQPTDAAPDGSTVVDPSTSAPTAPTAPQAPDAPTAQASATPQPSTAHPYPAPTQPQYQYNPYYNPYAPVRPNDAPHIGYAILGFFFPLVGLILYLVWKDETPQRAKSAGKGALIGFITGVVLTVILVIVWFVLIGWMLSEAWYY